MIYQEIFSDVDTKMEKTNSKTEVNDPVIGNSFDTTARQIMEYLKLKLKQKLWIFFIKFGRYSSDFCLIFVIITICMKADTFIIPMQNENAILYISVSTKQAKKGKGPKTDLEMPPRDRVKIRTWNAFALIRWISAVT